MGLRQILNTLRFRTLRFRPATPLDRLNVEDKWGQVLSLLHALDGDDIITLGASRVGELSVSDLILNDYEEITSGNTNATVWVNATEVPDAWFLYVTNDAGFGAEIEFGHDGINVANRIYLPVNIGCTAAIITVIASQFIRARYQYASFSPVGPNAQMRWIAYRRVRQ